MPPTETLNSEPQKSRAELASTDSFSSQFKGACYVNGSMSGNANDLNLQARQGSLAERNLPQQVVTKRQSSTGMSSENDESESVSEFEVLHLQYGEKTFLVLI